MLARRSLAVLKEGIESGLFSGAAYALISKRAAGGTGTLGRVAFDDESDRVNRDTLFDVASLTKPLAMAMAILQLVDRGQLRLEDDVSGILEGRKNLSGVTVLNLLTHTAGLPAVPVGANADHSDVLEAALGAAPVSAPGSSYLYSDTGYIVLGEIVRQVGGKPLDAWYAEEIARPLYLTESRFQPDVALPIVAAMEDETYDGKPHDPRARAMGGVAGHAGLFASINDISAYVRALLGSGKALLTPVLFDRLFENELGESVGHQSLAFFTRRNAYMPDISGFSEGSVGHSGFTGCFLWIDRGNQVAACLLTNRVLNTEQDSSVFLELRQTWLAAAAQDLGLL